MIESERGREKIHQWRRQRRDEIQSECDRCQQFAFNVFRRGRRCLLLFRGTCGMSLTVRCLMFSWKPELTLVTVALRDSQNVAVAVLWKPGNRPGNSTYRRTKSYAAWNSSKLSKPLSRVAYLPVPVAQELCSPIKQRDTWVVQEGFW